MITYHFFAALIPLWAWTMRRIYRQPPPVRRFRHAAAKARPRPLLALTQRQPGERAEILPGLSEVTV